MHKWYDACERIHPIYLALSCSQLIVVTGNSWFG